MEEIFILRRSETQIGIFIPEREVAEFAVLVLGIDEIDSGHCEHECIHLLREGSRKIDLLPIFDRISISSSDRLIVDFVRDF